MSQYITEITTHGSINPSPFPSYNGRGWQPHFSDEKLARAYLEKFLDPWFKLAGEVILQHPLVKNRLRMDFLATPREKVDFPFGLFGIEIKASPLGIGDFNKALKQAIDYRACEIADKRELLTGVRGERLEYVYVFPAPAMEDSMSAWHGGSERLAGLFHVGLIRANYHGNPRFCMSADMQWDADYGPRRGQHCTVKRVGSGVTEKTL